MMLPAADLIPPEVRALISDVDLAGLAEGGELDDGLLLHLAEEALYAWPAPETAGWVQAAIAANPGVWTARLCRARHGLAETFRSIAYCGQCAEYANPRKRRRAAKLPPKPLPGFEATGGAYQLHPPCSRRGLTWLRHTIYRLEARSQVVRRCEVRPDLRQARGWDTMTTLYPYRKGE